MRKIIERFYRAEIVRVESMMNESFQPELIEPIVVHFQPRRNARLDQIIYINVELLQEHRKRDEDV